MADNQKVGIFPASGGLGGSTLSHLAHAIPASQIIAIVRDSAKIPQQLVEQGLVVREANYDEDFSLSNAFDGISTLNLISYPTFAHEHRSKVHKQAIDAAKASGVKHIIYSSLAFAGNGDQKTSRAHVMQAHLDTEKYLNALASQDESFSYTIIRIGLYSESFPIYTAFFNPKSPTSEILIPHDGSGPGISWAKRDELGEAVALIVKSSISSTRSFDYINQTVLLSGPREYSLRQTVEVLGRVSKKDVKIKKVSVEEYAKQEQVQNGLGGDLGALWATAWDAISEGETAVVTTLLKNTLGREPESFETTVKDLA